MLNCMQVKNKGRETGYVPLIIISLKICPDITVMVDWALKQLSISLFKILICAGNIITANGITLTICMSFPYLNVGVASSRLEMFVHLQGQFPSRFQDQTTWSLLPILLVQLCIQKNTSLVQFSSRWYVCTWKSPPLRSFPQHCL